MFGSNILEVAIGLGVVYFLLSLVVTTVTEMIARVFALRSGTLEDGIRNLLTDSKASEFFDNPLIKKLGLEDKRNPLGMFGVKKGLPSYISSEYFSLALFDTLFPPGQDNKAQSLSDIEETIKTLPDDLKRPILALLNNADKELKDFRKEIEGWYDELMERVNGWYTRKAKLIAFIIAILVAVVFNVDTIMMANMLTRNAALRESLNAAAETIVANELENENNKSLGEQHEELLGTGIVGWANVSVEEDPRGFLELGALGVLSKTAGLLLTGVLVSLGAPFWFDMLNKLTNIRSSGPANDDEENGGQEGGQQTVKLEVTTT